MSPQLKKCLDEAAVKYVAIAHSPAFTTQEIAAATHLAGSQMAKTVVVELDGTLALAVVPANKRVVLQDLQDATGCERVKLVAESGFRDRFPDCELGAMPPFGNLYGMEVFIAPTLAVNKEIAFNAGSHTEVVRMPYADYERLVHPKVMALTA